MKHTRIYLRHGLSILLIALLSLGQPAALVLADDASTSSQAPASSASSTTPDPGSTSTPAPVTIPSPTTDPTSTGTSASTPAPTTPGPTQPTGPQTPTGPSQNTIPVPDYAFNDATQHWDPTLQSSFNWNQSLGRWVSSLYSYDSVVGWYHVIPTPPASSSNPTTTAASSNPTNSVVGLNPTAGSGSAASNDPVAELAQLLGISDPSISNTGPGSTNTGIANDNSNAMLNLLANALVNNNDTSTATTGNAAVSGNTSGGSATTGAASVVDNLLNLLNAAWSLTNGDLGYFSDNLFGNQTGDILLNPTVSTTGNGSQLGSTGGALSSINGTGSGSTNTAADNSNNNLTVNNKPTGTINNTVNALAQSGNAGVTGNTAGGDATSGDASADVNILNLINSAINAGQSFLGLVNIFGNLNGDILFPDGFLNGVGATSQNSAAPGGTTASVSNTGPGSTNTASTNQNNNTTINNDPSAAFANNINTVAQSGAANVSNNTGAGSAASGNTTTDNNLFNLFNDSVLGDNAVLVLVNVMGHWVGHIMNLPNTDASTGALLTGNATVTQNNTGPGSTNTTNVNQNNNTTINNSPSGTITNTINAGAVSGDATVSGNTSAGNATSGNASVATNIANIFGSSLNLKKWFGVLVINVFGDWTGSVADNTSAGNTPTTTATPSVVGLGGAVASTITKAFSTILPSHQSAQTTGGNTGTTGSSVGGSVGNTSTTSIAAITAAAHEPVQVAAKSAAHLTSIMIVLAVITLMLAAAAFKLERRLGEK